MNNMDFNFVGKRIVCEMANGQRVDGVLKEADPQAFYIEEDAGAYIHRIIVYKSQISHIMCPDLKNKEERMANRPDMVSSPGIRVF
ncbi:MAG: hypothetical protein IK115_11120 [Lachnospiraceae bacterium]|nr:hypothetical protein [Lachnospiraceae bacterium]